MSLYDRSGQRDGRATSPNVMHHTLDLDGVTIFCREAGPKDAPVVLVPHR
jgi:hypothetical protein